MPDDPITVQQEIDSLKAQVLALQTNPPLAFHTHTGFDMNKVNWSDLQSRIVYIPFTIPGTSPATAANYSTFYISNFVATITSFKEVHAVIGSDAGAVTLQLEKLTSTTAPGSGTSLLTSALSLKATANTVQTGSLTTTLANINLAVGDRLALKLAGTPTSVANVTVLLGLTF